MSGRRGSIGVAPGTEHEHDGHTHEQRRDAAADGGGGDDGLRAATCRIDGCSHAHVRAHASALAHQLCPRVHASPSASLRACVCALVQVVTLVCVHAYVP